MATGDLITLGALQTAYPRLSADQLADAPQIISAISTEISLRCPRAALRATWDETVDPGNHRTIRLKYRPVLRINRIRADLSPVLRIFYQGAARRALVEVVTTGEASAPTPVSLSLSEENTGVTSAVATFAFTASPTVQTLADGVNAHASGWTASVAPNQGAMASIDLEPLQGPKSAVAAIGSQTWPGAGIYGYVRDLSDYTLTDARNGELLVYEWRADSYQDPGRMWGVDPRACTLRVNYDFGRNVVTDDVSRAAIICVGACLESTDKPGIVQTVRSDHYEYRLADPTYRFPQEAERILSRYKNRRFV